MTPIGMSTQPISANKANTDFFESEYLCLLMSSSAKPFSRAVALSTSFYPEEHFTRSFTIFTGDIQDNIDNDGDERQNGPPQIFGMPKDHYLNLPCQKDLIGRSIPPRDREIHRADEDRSCDYNLS